MRGGRQN